jgi:hypothetical protein
MVGPYFTIGLSCCILLACMSALLVKTNHKLCGRLRGCSQDFFCQVVGSWQGTRLQPELCEPWQINAHQAVDESSPAGLEITAQWHATSAATAIQITWRTEEGKETTHVQQRHSKETHFVIPACTGAKPCTSVGACCIITGCQALSESTVQGSFSGALVCRLMSKCSAIYGSCKLLQNEYQLAAGHQTHVHTAAGRPCFRAQLHAQ